MFRKVLVANRGEIAVRIIRTLKEMNIDSVAICSDVDRDSLHCRYADYTKHISGCKTSETYMNMEKILEIALEQNVDAIHPGYGFLSENEKFAHMLEQNGITFIGPDAKTIELMGNKIAARQMMVEIGIPMVPGSDGCVEHLDDAWRVAEKIGYPIMIKAAAGGGGIGMQIARNPQELSEVFARVGHQAKSVFGDGSVFIEKYLENARHIEIQVLADRQGNVVHLGERDCSIQRRHQKIIEESPSPIINDELRYRMGQIAISIAKATDYHSAGTVEFIFNDGEFYFLEMNTRLQVEHPITEMVTGIDIVKNQIKIAAGMPLEFGQDDIVFKGHAIESRICAEDPQNNFMPFPGKITHYSPPGGIGVRIDCGVHLGYEIPHYYDSMISKLVVWEQSRAEAINRMKRALGEYEIIGPKTNITYLGAVMENDTFKAGCYNTKFVDEEKAVFEVAEEKEKEQQCRKYRNHAESCEYEDACYYDW